MPALAIPAIIGLAGTVANAVTGHSAATNASNIQSAAADKASGASLEAGKTAIAGVNTAATTATTGINEATKAAIEAAKTGTAQGNEQLQSTLQTQRANLQPYQQAGQTGLTGLTDLAKNPQDFKFDTKDFENDPSTAIAIQRANEAIQKSAAIRTGLGGGTLKAIARETVDQTEMHYGDVYKRSENTFNTNKDNRFRTLTALTGVGERATSQLNAAEGQTGRDVAGNLVDLGNTTGKYGTRAAEVTGDITTTAARDTGRLLTDTTRDSNNYLLDSANAKASGVIGRAKAIQGGVTGATNIGVDLADRYYGNRRQPRQAARV